MRYRTTKLAMITAVGVAVLAGCTPEPNGPPVEGSATTSENAEAVPRGAATATPGAIPDCRNAKSAEWKMRHSAPPFKPSAVGDIEMRVTPVFVGSPSVDEVRLEDGINGDAQARHWSHEVDPHTVLLTVVADASEPHSELDEESLESLRVREAPTDGGSEYGGCGDEVEVTSQIVGSVANEEVGTVSTIWEVTAENEIAMDPGGLFTAVVGGTQLQQQGAARVHGGGDDIYASLGDTPEARADLAFYYAHR